MSGRIKFHVPDECRNFVLFSFLPVEIRQRIWEAYLSAPGIHFVRLQTSDGSWSWGETHTPRPAAAAGDGHGATSDEIARVVNSDGKERKRFDTCFVPVGPCPRADVSQYKALRRQLATLSRTCHESRAVVKRLCNRPDTLRVNDGQILCLGMSSDVVYLEYLPTHLYQRNGNLESIPDCPGLKHIRRLAVRFSHTWIPPVASCSCGVCKGSQDDSRSGSCPAHLYQFLVRHLPNLEEFFFVDYFIVHKSCSEPGVDETFMSQAARCSFYYVAVLFSGPKLTSSSRTARFQAGNRLYHEANPVDWVMTDKVTQITEWLRESYVRYARESALSSQKKPERVRFAVLACEWNIPPPIQHSVPLASHSNSGRSGVRPGGSRKRPRLSLFEGDAHKKPTTESTTEVVMADENSNQKFTFRSLLSPGEMPSSETMAAHARGAGIALDTVYRQLGRGGSYLVRLLTGKQ
ncbi:hypothetical protein E4U41_001180 [Claviceps citrina]|nr:hypothetical protein E4U41_001180 [Claviceps citrina]